MANSFVRYTGDGNTSTFSIPFSYRVAGDLTVTVNAVATTAFTFNAAGTTITFTSPQANASAIEIKSAVGAQPHNLMIFVKHPFWIPNRILQWALLSIPQPKWVWRNALKESAHISSHQTHNSIDRGLHSWLSCCDQ